MTVKMNTTKTTTILRHNSMHNIGRTTIVQGDTTYVITPTHIEIQVQKKIITTNKFNHRKGVEL